VNKFNALPGRKPERPEKPTPDFPLFPHASGRWAKKVNGRLVYFGPWDDPSGALKRWHAAKDDLRAGRIVKPAKLTGRTQPKRRRGSKPAKPWPDFPLFPHASGRWAKKVNGRFCYFGKWADDPKGAAAIELWLDQKDDLLAGRAPRGKSGAATVADVADAFMVFKRELVDSGELTERTWSGYKEAADILVSKLGPLTASELTPTDFQKLRATMAAKWGPVRLGNMIQVVRSVFLFGFDQGILESSVRFGQGFKKPSAKTLRKSRAANGPKMFTPEQIKALLKHASPNLKAMALLAINGGLGNTDVAELPIDALDLKAGWLDFPRGKTGIPRRIKLWPETVQAIEAAREKRPDDPRPYLFIGPRGIDYVATRTGYRVTAEFDRYAEKAGIEGRTFYDLRRTFQTIGEGARDLSAVQAIMGHAPASGDMSAIYRQTVDDKRLAAVADHVRKWLWPEAAKR
jgi:integrase